MATEITRKVATFDITVHGETKFSGAFKSALEEQEWWVLRTNEEMCELVHMTDCYVYTYFMIPTSGIDDNPFSCTVEIQGNFYSPINSYIYQDDAGTKQLHLI